MGRIWQELASGQLGGLVVIGAVFAPGLAAVAAGFLDLGTGAVGEVTGIVGFALLFTYFRIEFWTAFLVDLIAA